MMYKKLFSIGTALAAMAVAVATIPGCGSSDAKEAAPGGSAPPPLAVNVVELRPQPLQDALQVAGIVKAYEDVLVSPEEGGVVKGWRSKKGDRVGKNELLVVLRDEVAKASFDAADAQYRMSQLNYEKQGKVFEEQGLSELQYKNMQYGRDAAKANADLMKARWLRTQIKSPVAGILDEQYFDEGEFAPPGVPIAHVVNIDQLKVVADVPEREAATVRTGAPALIVFDALSGDTVRGRVSFVGSTVSANNRALTVEIVVPNPRRLLKPEMIGKVRILRESKSNALIVSENAIQLVDMHQHVVFVEENGKAFQRTVRLGGREDGHFEVVEGLRPGDRVITTDVEKLVNGQSVAVVAKRAN